MDLLMLMGDAVGRSTSLSCLFCQVYYMARFQHRTATAYSCHPVNENSLYRRVLQRIALAEWLFPRIKINPLLKTKPWGHYSPFHCSPVSARTLLFMKGPRLRPSDNRSVKMVSEALVEWYWGRTPEIHWRKKNCSTITLSTINVTLTGSRSIEDWN